MTGNASGTIRGREYNAFNQAHDWCNTTLFASMLPCLTIPVCFAYLSPLSVAHCAFPYRRCGYPYKLAS
jgi:hypothetical protein